MNVREGAFELLAVGESKVVVGVSDRPCGRVVLPVAVFGKDVDKLLGLVFDCGWVSLTEGEGM